MSESPSCDAVMTRPTSASFPASSSVVSSNGPDDSAVAFAAENAVVIDDEDAPTPPDEGAATPVSPSTPVAPVNDIVMEEAEVEMIGSTTGRVSTPVAANV